MHTLPWDYLTFTPLILFVLFLFYRIFGKTSPKWPVDTTTIPRRIFVAVDENTSLDKKTNIAYLWQKLNPFTTVRVYSFEDCRISITDLGDWTVDLFDNLPKKQQLDFWRICILYLYGGVAVDDSVTPVSRFDHVFSANTTFATSYVPIFLAATPANSIIEHIIDHYHERRHQFITYDRSILADAIEQILFPLCLLDVHFQTVHNFGQKVTILQTKHTLPRPWPWQNDLKWTIWRNSITLLNNENIVFLQRHADNQDDKISTIKKCS